MKFFVKGFATYFKRREGFSINEGGVPNLCVRWWKWQPVFYVYLWGLRVVLSTKQKRIEWDPCN